MPRKPTSGQLVASFLALSAGVSVALVAVRNPYDDELYSLDLSTGPVRQILAVTAEGDVHPPGMYLLTHFALRLLPSFRWVDLFPAVFLYAGLAVFLAQAVPLVRTTRARILLLLLATLHPQLVMWGASIRWYGWWTGLALIAVTVALQPGRMRPRLSYGRAGALGMLFAGLFYLNYITLAFVGALGVAAWLRYRVQAGANCPAMERASGAEETQIPFGNDKQEGQRQMQEGQRRMQEEQGQKRERPWPRVLVCLAVFALLIAPQLHTFVAVHLPDSHAQRYSIAASILRLVQSIVVSEAFLPWHPFAILAGCGFAGLVAACAGPLRGRVRMGGSWPEWASATTAIGVFGVAFFLLVALSGLGGKPRNGLLLVPVVAVAAAQIADTLRPRVQGVVLACFALWSVTGTAHMLGRYGLAKSTMIDRPEQAVALIRSALGAQGQPACAVVVTYDSILAFTLAHADIPHLTLISPYRGAIYGGEAGGPLSRPPAGCASTRLFLVRSYLGGPPGPEAAYNREEDAAAQFFVAAPGAAPQIDRLSPDPDAAAKRRLAHVPALGGDLEAVSRLPDYRYTVASGPIDPADLAALRTQLYSFPSGNEDALDSATP